MNWLNQKFLGDSLDNWILFVLVVISSFIIARFCYWLTKKIIRKKLKKNKYSFDDILLDLIEEPFIFLIILFGFSYGFSFLSLPVEKNKIIYKSLKILYYLDILWFIVRLSVNAVKQFGRRLVDDPESKIDDHILNLSIKVVKIIIWITGLVIILNISGINVTALIGGLGIGGIALAMAAKDSISNIFGGITIFIDKPFKLGDWIKIEGISGTIVDIGLRISKIKTLEGRIVTVPNTMFIGSPIENITLEPTRKVVLDIGLIYNTSEEKMKKAIDLLNEIAVKNANLNNEHLVFFDAFNDSSLGIKFIYYINKSSNIFATKTEINIEILKIFNENDLEMAFPTRTIYNINS